MVSKVNNVFDTVEPLAIFLKIIGFLPIFWHQRCSIRQHVCNAIVCILNVVLSLAVAYRVVASFIFDDSLKQDFVALVSNNCLLLVLFYGYPIILIVAGFLLSNRFKLIIVEVYECDLKVRGFVVVVHHNLI